jgi:uncharacterized protein
MTSPNDVVDDLDTQRFLYRDDDNDAEAELSYRVNGDQLILVHTGVPSELSGQGIGGHLVRAAVHRAAASGETIAPWCSYARDWLEDHADEVDDVDIDWTPAPGE